MLWTGISDKSLRQKLTELGLPSKGPKDVRAGAGAVSLRGFRAAAAA